MTNQIQPTMRKLLEINVKVNFPEIPTFTCIEREGSLIFECPICKKENRHGSMEGHRVSHCGCWPKGYDIVKFESDEIPWLIPPK